MSVTCPNLTETPIPDLQEKIETVPKPSQLKDGSEWKLESKTGMLPLKGK